MTIIDNIRSLFNGDITRNMIPIVTLLTDQAEQQAIDSAAGVISEVNLRTAAAALR